MRLTELSLSNFKGINELQRIPLKPITVVIGPNSSGKSSIIHALTCLGQSAKLHTDTRPIILDDERADIHLGRFIEVIHSKKYSDKIGLGVCASDALYSPPRDTTSDNNADVTGPLEPADMSAYLEYGCTKRTQDISLHSASLSIGDYDYSLRKHGTGSILYAPHFSKGRLLPRLNKIPADPIRTMTALSASREEFTQLLPFFDINSTLLDALSRIKYLGPFRQAPSRTYPTHGAVPTEVGATGESTIGMLANEAIQSRNRVHIDQIAHWLAHLQIGTQLKVSRISGSHLFDASLELPDGNSFPLADLGYGTSQVLPVLAQCSFAEEECTLLFEQPELHLHSACARRLAGVFIDTANASNRTIVIETHSPDLIKEFLREIGKGTLSTDDFVLYKTERHSGSTHVHEVEIDKYPDGIDVIENWESGISI